MEVNGDYRPASVSQPAANIDTPPREAASAKIPEGTIIQGEVVNVQRGQITVRTDDGQLITGQSAKALEALIGLRQSFAVKYDGQAALILESVAAPDMARNAMLTDLLKSYGLKAGPENMDMLMHLLQNNFPLDQKTVAQFNRAWRLMDADPAKALFFLQNDMPVNSKNAELLNGFADGTAKLNMQLKSLVDSLSEIADPALRERIAQILLRDGGGGIITGTTVGPESAGVTEQVGVLKQASMPEQAGVPKQAGVPEQANAPKQTGLTEQAGVIEQNRGGDMTLPGRPVSGDAAIPSGMAGAMPGADAMPLPAAAEPSSDIIGKIRDVLTAGELTGEKVGEIIREWVGGNATLSRGQVNQLLKSLLEIPDMDKSGLERLRGLLEQPNEKSGDLVQRLTARLALKMENTGPKDVDHFLNNLRDDIHTAAEEIAKMPVKSEDTARTFRELEQVREHIDFVAHVKNNLFVQLPLLVNSRETHAELYVFREGKKAGKGKSGVSSALIALDTVNLGRFETYIQKADKAIHLQFRLDNKSAEQLVRQNIPKLNQLLEEYGLHLSGLIFKQVDESFTLLSKEPVAAADDSLPGHNARVVFDMRT